MSRTFRKYPSNYIKSSKSNKNKRSYTFEVQRVDAKWPSTEFLTLHVDSWQEAIDTLNNDETIDWWQIVRD